MTEVMNEPRKELKPQTPKIIILEIPKSTIGGVIGPGGKVIQELHKTETTISIEEVDEHGRVEILGTNQDGIDTVSKIKSIAFVPEEGETYTGKVKSIMPYGHL